MMLRLNVLTPRLGRPVAVLLLIGGAVLGIVSVASTAPLENLQEIPMWPNGPPGSARFPGPQEILERSKDPAVQDRAVLAITNPELFVYRPERSNGTALLVTPGGA